MLTTPHAVTGAALGALLVNPLLVVPAAIGSHFLLDMTPHWQETLAPYTPTWKTWTRIPFDLALAVGLVSLIVVWHPAAVGSVWLGAVCGNLPDADVALMVMPKLKRGWLTERFFDWHCKIQRETASLWGVAPQVAVIGLGLAAAYATRAS